ncbi:unnamed protein product [Schistosoma curassoni]|nr:unnamed protein product [Schistosoma curassoni]
MKVSEVKTFFRIQCREISSHTLLSTKQIQAEHHTKLMARLQFIIKITSYLIIAMNDSSLKLLINRTTFSPFEITIT